MSWLKKKLRNWLSQEDICIPSQVRSNQPAPTISLFEAINGNVLQVQYHKPGKSMHSDGSWEMRYFVLKEGESVSDAIATLLVSAKLDQK